MKLILGHRGVYFVAPGQDAALHVAGSESVLLEQVYGFRAAHAAFAVGYDFDRRIQVVEAFWQLTERNQLRSGDAADLVFVRLAHVDEDEVVAAIDFRFHLNRIDVAFRCHLLQYTAKLLVIDQLRNCWVVAADWAFRILDRKSVV